jgi:hypothetical protein
MADDSQQYCPEADWDPSSGIMATRACYTCRKGFVSHKHLESEWGDEADPRIYSILPKMLFELDAGKEPRPTEKIYHKPTCEAIYHRSYQYDIEVNFDVTKMKQFFHKAEEAMKEREAFMRAFKQFQDVEHRFYDIKKRRERKEEEERYIRNKALWIGLIYQFRNKAKTCAGQCDFTTRSSRETYLFYRHRRLQKCRSTYCEQPTADSENFRYLLTVCLSLSEINAVTSTMTCLPRSKAT